MQTARQILSSLGRQLGLQTDAGAALLTHHRGTTRGYEIVRVVPGHGYAILAATLVFPVAGTDPEGLDTDDILALINRDTLENAAAIAIENDIAFPSGRSDDYQSGWVDAVKHVTAQLTRLAADQHAHRYKDAGTGRGSRCVQCDAREPRPFPTTAPQNGA